MQDDGKYASRFSAKPSGGLCAVLPKGLITLWWGVGQSYTNLKGGSSEPPSYVISKVTAFFANAVISTTSPVSVLMLA